MHFWCGIPYKPSFATVTGGGVGVDPKDPPSPGGHLHPKEILLIVKTLALTWDLDEPPWFNWDLDEPPWFKHTYIYIYTNHGSLSCVLLSWVNPGSLSPPGASGVQLTCARI